MIEDTSGNRDALLLSKELVSGITARCSEESYKKIEDKIIHFVPSNAKRNLKQRIEFNREKQKNGGTATWRFWGFFQKEMLAILPRQRMSREAQNLLSTLQRSISGKYSPYHYNDGHGGSVWSPVAGKKLSFRNWKGIITNKKIPKERTDHWKKVKGGFIESTVFEFASDFRGRVSEKPIEFLQNMLDFDGEVIEEYVNALFDGIAYSEHLDEIDIMLLEKLFKKYGYDYENERAKMICRIIERRKDVSWSDAVIEMLIDIAENHKNPEPEESCIVFNDTKTMNSVETLETDAINCTRGVAASAIGHLLWERKELFVKFKPTIIKLMQDENTAVRFASLDALWPIYNIDKVWAVSNVLTVFKSDNRTIGYRGSKLLFVCVYEKHKAEMKSLLEKSFFSSDKRLIQISGYAIAEIYLRYDAFENILNQIDSLNKEQADALLAMFIVYLEREGYNIFLDEKYKGDVYLYDSERDSFMMALKALGYSMNTEDEGEIQEAYEWLVRCVETMDTEIVTDEIIDNMAQGRKALGLIYSGDASYVMAENENMGYYMPETGTNLWSDAMVIPKNAENPDLAHAFINFASDYDGAYDNSSYVGYTSANQEVMDVLSGEGGDYEGINAYIPRTDNENDEVFVYNENTKKIISDLWSRVKIAASNAGS